MAAGNKFGTFGGVFTPSILTILGVIMYLRLPRIVGEGGLFIAVGIILAAHLISVTTGLSVSSIATDKRVEAGGAYYIVSRSMGLAIGGTLGLALFVGLSFSISLYIIGFSESFLEAMTLDKNLFTIRVCGTITLVLLTIITFVSTELAIKAQYWILLAIVASLVSIFMGGSEQVPLTPHLSKPLSGGQDATVLFGIFFPAVTGFTAGVNMSGDLRDPRRAIPLGTVVAIAVGLVVYVALAVFVAYRIDPSQMLDKDTVLVDIAAVPQLVVAGIWGATISSALGSILGAPRILQALSLDQITPRIFGVGHGVTNEPRYALVLAFAIAEMGILIGELDAIARIVSVFFIATYGFLNLSASFEMVASPDFRPDFKIPTWVPVVGAVTCGILMVWLDLIAMLGAVVVLSALFFVIKRRELQLETGDTLLGVWSSVVRVGLNRLTTESLHQRNWRPNILLFTQPLAHSRQPLLEFGHSLIRHRGVATEFLLSEAGRAEVDEVDAEGFFHRHVKVRDPDRYDTMSAVCRFHGFSGLEPNTVMVDWHDHAQRPAQFAKFLGLLKGLDVNVVGVAYDPEKGFGEQKTIDLWWSASAGSLDLNIALVRFVSSSEEWRRASLRFLVVNDDPSLADSLHNTTVRALAAARITGTVKVVNNALEARSAEDWIAHHSARTDLTVIGLPNDELGAKAVRDLEQLVQSIGCVILVRASSQFRSGFDFQGASTLRARPPELDESGPVRLRPPRLPTVPGLEAPARQFVEEHASIVAEFTERCVSGSFEAHTALLERIREAVDDQFREFEGALAGKTKRWRARVFRRGPEQLLTSVTALLRTYQQEDVTRTLDTMERGIDRFLERLDALEDDMPRRVDVTRDLKDFAPHPDDPRWMARTKARRRWVAYLSRGPVRYAVRPGPLVRYTIDARTLQLARTALYDAAKHTMQVNEDLGRFLHVLKESLASISAKASSETLDEVFLATERDRVRQHAEGLLRSHSGDSERQVLEILQSARDQQQEFADDLAVINLKRHVRHNRRMPRDARYLPQELDDIPERWAQHHALWLGRAGIAVVVALVQMRLTVAIEELCAQVEQGLAQGVRSQCANLLAALEQFRGTPGEPPVAEIEASPPVDGDFDATQLVEDLHRVLQEATGEAPEALEVLREASLQQLVLDPFAEVEVVSVSLRRQLRFVIDGELVGPIQEILAEVPRAEQRASSTAEDVVRLMSFTVSDVDTTDQGQVESGLRPVLDSGIERIEAEVMRLAELSDSLQDRIRQRLEQVLDQTNAFAVQGTAEAFEAHGRRLGAADLSGLGRLTERVRAEATNALVTLAYRRSAGVLLARRMSEPSPEESPVDGVLALVDDCTPAPEVLEALPSYYVQLFSGQSALHSAFWVGRIAELERIERGIAHDAQGFHGAVLVTGDPGSGKTALCEVAIERFLQGRPVYRVSAPAGGACSLDVFRQTVQAELNAHGDLDDVFEGLPEGAVVLFANTELWWERTVRGLAVLDRLADLVERHSDRVLFFIEIGSAALQFLERFSAFGAGALARVECGPVDAETLKEIVALRHNSTGLRYSLAGRQEAEVSGWALAQLFTGHFDHSDGTVGAALHSWLAHVERVEGDSLVLDFPSTPVDDALDTMSMGWVGLLVQLVLHKELTVERLLRVTGQPKAQLMRDLAALRRTGLVTQDRSVLALEPRSQHLVLRSLRRRGVLP
ncbi:MAG: hypothetical protein KTR31_17275 [Myxococcales bacterium]|nr:hypothetical protein [Myxococcales bacterium]